MSSTFSAAFLGTAALVACLCGSGVAHADVAPDGGSAEATPVAVPVSVPVADLPAGRVPEWIDDAQFERQLRLVHGKSLDPNLGLFGPHSQMWRMLRYIAPGAVGSGRALLLQISHPWVTAGIDEHSVTREDPLKRGRDTFRYLLTMIYGSRDQALEAARDVRTIHAKIRGAMPYDAGPFPRGSEYRANEAQAMLWVHATLWESIVIAYEQSVGPVSDIDKERFYQETKIMAYLFGIPDEALPKDWNAFLDYCAEMRRSGVLQATPAAKQLQQYLFGWHGVMLWLPLKYAKVATAANLPPDLREQYGLKYGAFRSAVFNGSMFASRIGHKITPGFITLNPAHKEAVARIAHKRASWWTRTQLKLALGKSRLVDEY